MAETIMVDRGRRPRSKSLGDKVDVREVLNGSPCFRMQFSEDKRANELKWVLFTESRRAAIGKIVFTLEAHNSAHVKVIEIHQNWRRLGLSKVLFLACMATLKQRNIHELYLEAEEDSRRYMYIYIYILSGASYTPLDTLQYACTFFVSLGLYRHQKLVSLYEEWGFSVKQNAKILFLYNDTECFRKVPMALSLQVGFISD
jgi:hypothetical protein